MAECVFRDIDIAQLFGKALGMMMFGISTGLFSGSLMLIVARQAPEIASYPYVLVSVIVIFIELAATAPTMAPVMVPTRGNIGINRVNRS
jgi:hypothetical protein